MLAYHNDPTIKKQVLEQLQRHYDAEEIVREKCRDDGKGFSMSSIFKLAENFNTFGMPKVLAHLEDAIFEGLPNEEAKNWPIRFMSAINVGADLSTVWRDFVIWLLIDPADGVIKYTQPGTDAHRVIMQVATLYQDGYTQQQMRDAAYDAAKAASYAAYDAAHAAYGAALAANAAEVAAKAAAYAASAAINAAYASAAASAAVFATYSAINNAALAARDDAFAKCDAHCIKMSNKLIELLEKQEVKHDHK